MPLAKHRRASMLAALSAWIAQGWPNAATRGLAVTGLPNPARKRRGVVVDLRTVAARGCFMDIALAFALGRAHAACQASSCLDACRTLGLDCTRMA